MFLRRSLLAVSLVALAATACTTTSQGEPRATPTETRSSGPTQKPSEDELPFAGAPAVDDPLDTSRYALDPCEALTATQVESLNLPSQGTIDDDVALGIGCNWKNADTRGEVKINFFLDDPRGLSPEYQADKNGKWAYFEELPDIGGYPAVSRDGVDDRHLGYCPVVVGVADDMVFEAIVQLSQANVGQKDPCEVAVQVAGMALQTMKGA